MQEEAYIDRLKFTDGLEQTSTLLCKPITEEKVVFSILTLKATFICSRWSKMIIKISLYLDSYSTMIDRIYAFSLKQNGLGFQDS